MSDRARLTALYIGAGLFGTLLAAPIWIGLGAWLAWAGEPLAAALLGPFGSLLGAAAGAARPLRRWVQLALALALGAAGAALCGTVLGLQWLNASLAGIALFYGWMQGVTVAERIGDTRWQWFGLLLYFGAAVSFPYSEIFAPAVPLLTWCGAASLAAALLVANGVFLRRASYSERKSAVPVSMRSYNRLMLSLLMGFAALLTVLFGNAFGKLLLALVRGLLGLLTRGGPGETPAEEPAGPVFERPELPPAEPAGRWALIWDIIAYAFGAAAALGLLFLAGRWLYLHGGEKFRAFVERLLAFLRRRRAQDMGEAGYTDEETDVFSWDAVGSRLRNTWLGRLFRRGREPKWEELRSNRERIRWLYRRWLHHAAEAGYEVQRALTPRETAADVQSWLAERETERRRGFGGQSRGAAASGGGPGAEELAELYDRVRYGNADVSDADIARARRAADLE